LGEVGELVLADGGGLGLEGLDLGNVFGEGLHSEFELFDGSVVLAELSNIRSEFHVLGVEDGGGGSGGEDCSDGELHW
jgi:hypothetical protein